LLTLFIGLDEILDYNQGDGNYASRLETGSLRRVRNGGGASRRGALVASP